MSDHETQDRICGNCKYCGASGPVGVWLNFCDLKTTMRNVVLVRCEDTACDRFKRRTGTR